MFLLRSAGPSDLAPVLELAHYLDSPNRPADEAFLRARLERSERAFAQPGPPSVEREYQFALEDAEGRVVGTCAVLSKHGTPDLPHLFLRVAEEERRSENADVCVKHVTLQLGASRDGPTELGALVLHPDVRGHAERPGRLLSWGRFCFIARRPDCFESQLMAEMRASFDEEGRNAFWDAFGRRFTGMSYAEADRRSVTDKTFILDLFPDTPFYASLLDEPVLAELGSVHPETQPALRLLERAGLHWIGEIDPFDAGPFVGASVDRVIPIRETLRGRVSRGAPDETATPAILATEQAGAFRAVAAPALANGTDVRVAVEALERLGLDTGDEISVTPLPPSRRGGPLG